MINYLLKIFFLASCIRCVVSSFRTKSATSGFSWWSSLRRHLTSQVIGIVPLCADSTNETCYAIPQRNLSYLHLPLVTSVPTQHFFPSFAICVCVPYPWIILSSAAPQVHSSIIETLWCNIGMHSFNQQPSIHCTPKVLRNSSSVHHNAFSSSQRLNQRLLTVLRDVSATEYHIPRVPKSEGLILSHWRMEKTKGSIPREY